MSASDWIQLSRNLFCVVRTLAPKDSLLFHQHLTGYSIPFNSLTTIEYAIVSSQLPAVYFFLMGAVRSFIGSRQGTGRYKRLLIELDQFRADYLDTQDGVGPEAVIAILRHALQNDIAQAGRQFFVGFSQLAISIAFVFFSLNTLHIKFPDHPLVVYNAVALLLGGLSYLLYTMVLSMNTRVHSVASARRLKRKLRASTNGNSAAEMVALAYKSGYGENMIEAFNALTASPESGSPTVELQYKSEKSDLRQVVATDLESIQSALVALRVDTETCTSDIDTPRRTRSQARANPLPSTVSAAVLDSIDARRRSEAISSVVTLVFFLVNFIAGYGYFLGVLAYYLPHEKWSNTLVGAAVKALMLQAPSGVADWWGGLAGDVAWTIEPVLVMLCPHVVKYAFKVRSTLL